MYMVWNFLDYLPAHGNNAITSEQNTYANELNTVPCSAMPSSIVAGMTDTGSDHSPNNNTMISSQIIGATPLNQIGCPLPIDHYAGMQFSFYYITRLYKIIHNYEVNLCFCYLVCV